MRHWFVLPMYVLALSLLFLTVVSAKEEPTKEQILDERMRLYLRLKT